MKKSLLATAGSLALIGALTGLAAFGGTAAAAAHTPAPAVQPPAISQPNSPDPAAVSTAVSAAPSAPTAPAQGKVTAEEAQKPESDQDNINYEEQGDHQGNNGVVEKNQAPGTEKDAPSEAEKAGPDTDKAEVQQ